VAGTPNKKAAAFQEQLEMLGFDPLNELITILRQGGLAETERASILCKVLEYVYPKRKALGDSELGQSDAVEIKLAYAISRAAKPL